MYASVLSLHSFMRWVVLALVAWAGLRALAGVLARRPFDAGDARTGLFAMVAADIQFLLGLLLYVFLSPITRTAFNDMGSAMGNSALRFFVIEHTFSMLLALVCVHLGRALPKRAATDRQKHRKAALFFLLALFFFLAGIPWPFLPYGRPLLTLPLP